MNQCTFMGRLTKEPELRATQSGTPVASFTIAVNRRKDSNGEQKTDFFDCVTWRNRAEFASRYLHKGQRVVVTGAMQKRDYTDKNDVKHWVAELIVENIYFADGKAENGRSEAPPTYNGGGEFDGFEEIGSADYLPF
jgi:single-strand DNA-binding protein